MARDRKTEQAKQQYFTKVQLQSSGSQFKSCCNLNNDWLLLDESSYKPRMSPAILQMGIEWQWLSNNTFPNFNSNTQDTGSNFATTWTAARRTAMKHQGLTAMIKQLSSRFKFFCVLNCSLGLPYDPNSWLKTANQLLVNGEPTRVLWQTLGKFSAPIASPAENGPGLALSPLWERWLSSQANYFLKSSTPGPRAGHLVPWVVQYSKHQLAGHIHSKEPAVYSERYIGELNSGIMDISRIWPRTIRTLAKYDIQFVNDKYE